LINHEKKGPIKPLTEKKSESNFITVECLLAFDKDEDKGQVLTLMRKFSSMVRFAYKRLMEEAERKELKKLLSRKYGINTRYSDDAILLAKQNLDSCVERRQNPKKLVFGSRELFEQLKKKHLTGKRRETLRQKWEERRYGILQSRMERVRGRAQALQKSWQVLSVALAFSCLESFRDLSPLKRVLLTRDWVGVAKRNGPVPPYLVKGRMH
jgi:predicted transposase